ncbi:hypothetical protein NQ318_005784, partial [Aromia moschata]
MKLYVFVCLLVLPSCCLLSEINNDSSKNYISSADFEFPKNRHPEATGRIIGGEEVEAHSYPFVVALLMIYGSEQYFCGGTLLYPGWVLTAAHCVDQIPDSTYVILGAHDVGAESEKGRIVIGASGYKVHEDWDNATLQNDVALIKLPYNPPSIYQKGNSSYADEIGTIVGWGQTEVTTTISNVLMKVNSKILSNEACSAIDPFQDIIVSSHLCASGDGPIGSCNGDSGGPIMADGVQVGIVSFGYKPCTAGKPSVFTRITDFEDWIEKHVRGSSNSL